MDKITREFLMEQISNTTYHRFEDATITICLLTLKSGFTVTGESACINPDNFNEEIGKRIAYENAFGKLWQLFGFELKQKTGGDNIYRLHKERSELSERLDKLKAFLNSAPELSINELDLLARQAEIMSAYLAILDTRLNLSK